MGMKPRSSRAYSSDPAIQAVAEEAVEAAVCYLQEETKVDVLEYKFTDAQALDIIKRTARIMAKK